MRVEHVFEVARPAQEVFSYLADVTNEAKWNPWARWVRKLSEGPIGPGSVFRGSYQGFGELDQDLSDYEPSRRLTFRVGRRVRLWGGRPGGEGDQYLSLFDRYRSPSRVG